MYKGLLLNRMTSRIRHSLELQEILSATVSEMRSFLDTDRVKIYRFEPDGSGQVIAESIAPNRLPSMLGLHFPAGDIPSSAREMYIKARQRAIVDVPEQRITLSRLESPKTMGDLRVQEIHEQTIEDILQRPVDPCHVEYLTNMGVQSSLVIPILARQSLWGLLVSHHSQPKVFYQEQIELVQMIADQVSIAISQSHLLSQAREKARREELINHISTLIHSPLAIEEILQTVLEDVVKLVKGSGGRLYLTSTDGMSEVETYTYGTQPRLANEFSQPLLEDYPAWQQLIKCDYLYTQLLDIAEENEEKNQDATGEFVEVQGFPVPKPQAITDIYQEPQLLEVTHLFHSTPIRSLLAMPLQYGSQFLGCLSIFRDGIDTDIAWAGKYDPDERQQRVRQSFEAWRELKLAQAQEWNAEEIEIVRSLSIHLTMAVMQHRLYRYEHQQRQLVEMRNAELKVARTIAEEANRLKSEFLSSTSHELRTPLASTLNYLRLLKEEFYDDEEELKEYIHIAYESTYGLVEIINDILDITKIEAGRMTIDPEYLNLPSLLQEQSDLFRAESRRQNIPLVIDCEVEQVYADKLKLKQILTNIIGNAFKFSNQGEIRLWVVPHQNPNLVKIAVKDTGIGIDPSQQDELFEPFVQADGSIKRRYGGTGLGLAICKRLVELMGGEIYLESAGVGKGTTVSFTLPLLSNECMTTPGIGNRE
ncbi:MAG: GAF domain-containing protein [Symploca sp. SIO1C2]|nr:GAF domain-containing protein [Symploca sp. SIO1C2]